MVEYFRISLAEKNIEIECHSRTVFKRCKGYLSDFVTPDLQISATIDELEAGVANLPTIEESYEGVATTRFYGEAENLIVCEKIAKGMLSFDTFLMHGSVVAYNGMAYMFVAPSGVGKTTRVKVWLETYPDSIVVNGDKPLIKITGKEAIACGTPWCGKEGLNTNTMVPLRAIFLLERAEESENDNIEEIGLGGAFPALLEQTYRPSDLDSMRKTIVLLKSLEGKVKIYRLHCAPTAEAVHLAYETARPRGQVC